ncbi:MAG: DUF1592 domain-containing protein [Myxococcota bacterium]
MKQTEVRILLALVVAPLGAATGCYSGVDQFEGGPGAGADGADDAGDSGDEGGDDGTDDGALAEDLDSQFPRLSHAQWENTVRDLLHLSEVPGLSSAFIDDPVAGGFDNQGSSFQVSPTLWGDYQRAAEAVADLVVADPDLLAGIAPPDQGQALEVRAQQFIERFGERAYRRPLTADQVDAYVSVFMTAGTNYDDLDDFAAGVHQVLQTMLQSPYFVYRVTSGEPDADGRIALDGYERASRLSYALWNTMPDDALLAAAASGDLDTDQGVAAQADRMLAHPYARAMVDDFHAQLLDFDRYLDQYRDPDFFPDFDPAVGRVMQDEAKRFIQDIIFDRQQGYTELLTSTHTFANDQLAAVYGLAPDLGDELVEVQLDPTQRSGLLTRSGFLMSRSYQVDPDPIHRGAFISFELLCNQQPAVPDNVTSVEPDPTKTNRERVDDHTGMGTCGAGCHTTLINDAGFAFEHYDATGAYRTTDNGHPVDAAASFRFDGELVQYADAVEFSHVMADSQQAHACYSRHLLEYLHGRKHREADAEQIESLGAGSRSGDLPIRQLIIELVTSDDFLNLRRHISPSANSSEDQ